MTLFMSTALALLLLLATVLQREVACSSAEARDILVRQVLSRVGSKVVRPDGSEGPGSPVRVNINYALLRILKADLEEGWMVSLGFLILSWTDGRLSFNHSSDIDSIRLDVSDIWTPDIELYNTGSPMRMLNRQNLAVVLRTGLVVWIPQVTLSSFCSTNRTVQTLNCTLQFMSWTYNGNNMDLTVPAQPEMAEFIANAQWSMEASSAERKEQYYPCCPEPYPSATFTFILAKRPE